MEETSSTNETRYPQCVRNSANPAAKFESRRGLTEVRLKKHQKDSQMNNCKVLGDYHNNFRWKSAWAMYKVQL